MSEKASRSKRNIGIRITEADTGNQTFWLVTVEDTDTDEALGSFIHMKREFAEAAMHQMQKLLNLLSGQPDFGTMPEVGSTQ